MLVMLIIMEWFKSSIGQPGTIQRLVVEKAFAKDGHAALLCTCSPIGIRDMSISVQGTTPFCCLYDSTSNMPCVQVTAAALGWICNTVFLAWQASKEGNEAVISALKQTLEAAMQVKQRSLRPEIQLLNSLLADKSFEDRAVVRSPIWYAYNCSSSASIAVYHTV